MPATRLPENLAIASVAHRGMKQHLRKSIAGSLWTAKLVSSPHLTMSKRSWPRNGGSHSCYQNNFLPHDRDISVSL